MDMDEMIALMAATIFAADEERDGGYREEAAKKAVAQAKMIWRHVLNPHNPRVSN